MFRLNGAGMEMRSQLGKRGAVILQASEAQNVTICVTCPCAGSVGMLPFSVLKISLAGINTGTFPSVEDNRNPAGVVFLLFGIKKEPKVLI